jgi:lysine 2,3-aminomutase
VSSLVRLPLVVPSGPSHDVSSGPPAASPDGAWQAEVRGAITSLEALEKVLRLTDDERDGVRHAMDAGFPLSITPYYASLMDADDPRCPVRRQAVPVRSESAEVPGDLRDPLGEEAHEVAPHLVQRYPDRALLLATDRCSVYCRFCTRSRMVGQGGGAKPLSALEPAFAYLNAHPEVRDVILSGGDPLVMSDARIESILLRLKEIPSVRWVRVATRTPVTLPQRITESVCRALRAHPAVWVMTHFNHPKELSPLSRAALARLVDHGLPVMNQSVLLRGVNDDAATLETLFTELVASRVRPYYLLQADPVRGTGHLRTPLSRGLELMAALQGRVSGLAVPKFIVDTPGGMGKVPLVPESVVARGPGTTTLRTWRGVDVDYVDPPSDCLPSPR